MASKEIEEHAGPAGWVEGIRQYVRDVRNELDKVTWPKRQEAIGGTIGVIVIVGVITLVLAVVDMTLARVVEWVLP